MTSSPEDDKDALDSLLSPPPAADDGALAAAVFARTVRVLARRRLARRLAYAAALAACYAAGLLTMRLLTPAVVVVEKVVERPAPAPAAPAGESPVALEAKAREDDARRAELLRRAGDGYLNDHGDVRSALRCYGRSLDAAPDEQRAVAPDDPWLLMAIKDAREKEKRHADAVP